MAGFVVGILSDKINLYTLITIGTLLAESALILSMIALFYKSYIICFFLGGLWGKNSKIIIFIGFCDCYFNGII
jgi:hypothetical protein